MGANEQSVLSFARVVLEATALSEAALAGDLEEARFRTHLLVAKADSAGFAGVARAAAALLESLGPPGESPRLGYGVGMLRIADELDSVVLATRLR
jgi:hypothetical protein